MTKVSAHSTFFTALLAGLVTLSGCGAAAADPTDTTPRAEGSAAREGQNAQPLAQDGTRRERGRGHHRGWGHRKHDPEKLFARMDKDGDGKILLADLPERLRDRLAKADADHDGALTREELKAAHEAHKAEWLKKIDTDGDGVVSDEEKAAARAKFRGHHGPDHDEASDGPDAPPAH